jgi:hypothetical protein
MNIGREAGMRLSIGRDRAAAGICRTYSFQIYLRQIDPRADLPAEPACRAPALGAPAA